MPQSSPLVSVIVVNWNGAEIIDRCLEALTRQTYSQFELIIVDNASTDDSERNLERKFPSLAPCVERLSRNLGFAAANNLGAKIAQGNWLVLLNPDAFPAPDWLEKLVLAASQHPSYASFASRLVQAHDPKLLDGAGDVYHISGLAWRRYHTLSADSYGDKSEEVFCACAAAAMYSRAAFWDVNGFDEDFFSYNEDVDLGFRLRLRGGRCWYVADAVVQHVGSATTGRNSEFAIYHGHRNMVWVYFKNMPSPLFWRHLPTHLIANLIPLVYFTLRGRARAIWRAKIDALRGLRMMLRKRREIQKTRRVAPRELERVMDRRWLSPYRRDKR
jgi:GT2 family glycosyltransferase